MPTLTIQRDRGWADKIRNYRIILDGIEIGQLEEGGKLHEHITEGSHLIEARIDWCGSQPLRIDAGSVDKAVFVRSALRGWRLIFPIFYILFNKNRYLILDLVR